MPSICLQAGHAGRTTGATGAPEERENNIRIRNRLAEILTSKGFKTTSVPADYDATQDFDLALSMHCDANYAGDEGGGFVDFPSPSIDFANAESKRIKEAIESEYFNHSGIRNVPTRSNPNTKFYYWWSNLTAKTPCVIIEMGESIDPHDKVLLADTDRIANAIARGICKAFNVPFEASVPPSPTPEPSPEPPVSLPKPPEVPIPPEPPISTPIPPIGPDINYLALLNSAKSILYGKGWPWTKVKKLKELLPN